MFESLKSKEEQKLSDAINRASCTLAVCDVGSDEYSKTLSHVERLYTIKAEKRKNRITPDTILIVAGNLFGILVIVAYEQKHVLPKAFGFVTKVK